MITPAEMDDEQLSAAVRTAETADLDPETVLASLRAVTTAHLDADRDEPSQEVSDA
jgi:hypothetical protein